MLKDYDFKVKLIRSSRQTTVLQVVGDTVLVRTNYATSDQRVNELLAKHRSWIRKKLKQPRDEEIFLLLGKEYQIIKQASDKFGYRFTDDSLICYVSDEKDLLLIYDEIYLSKQERLKSIIAACLAVFPYQPKEIRIKRLKRTFGICHANKKVSINLYVLKYSEPFIRMIIFHELCHLVEMNHSLAFYDLLKEYVPNYKQLRKEANN